MAGSQWPSKDDFQIVAERLASSLQDKLPSLLASFQNSNCESTSCHISLQCELQVESQGVGEGAVSANLASIDLSTLLATRPRGTASTDTDNVQQLRPIVSRKRKLTGSTEQETPSPRSAPAPHQIVEGNSQDLVRRSAASFTTPLQKIVRGVWKALFSDMKLDPSVTAHDGHLIHSFDGLKILEGVDPTHADPVPSVYASRGDASRDAFSHANKAASRVCQASKLSRAWEVIVQARWIQCFDARVHTLGANSPIDIAKRRTFREACADFGWSEKELRNRMSVWRGYQEIAQHGGYVFLAFAGPGLYRFCKYRSGFDDRSLRNMESLRPRFEVAADTLHPGWRRILDSLGISCDSAYAGHLHDWVFCGPRNEPSSLAASYRRWTNSFSYTHIHDSIIDDEAWGSYDPRTTSLPAESGIYLCATCHEAQQNDDLTNGCQCFPTLYGHSIFKMPPLQILQTTNGKNNGLFACLPFEDGEAVGEFCGQITSGITGLDVMFGHTRTATYQIWQGKMGNYTRFVNHSCRPNAEYQQFDWRGKQRIVLVSKGIAADEEITVDYSDVYWEGLNKSCLCGESICRYKKQG